MSGFVVRRAQSNAAPASPAMIDAARIPILASSACGPVNADHIRAELVADAVQMATWRRRPPKAQTIAHSDHGSQYTSWLFGNRLRSAGLLGSMGTGGDCFDNSVAEAFFSGLQRELLDQHKWDTREQLALAMFDWIETQDRAVVVGL